MTWGLVRGGGGAGGVTTNVDTTARTQTASLKTALEGTDIDTAVYDGSTVGSEVIRITRTDASTLNVDVSALATGGGGTAATTAFTDTVTALAGSPANVQAAIEAIDAQVDAINTAQAAQDAAAGLNTTHRNNADLHLDGATAAGGQVPQRNAADDGWDYVALPAGAALDANPTNVGTNAVTGKGVFDADALRELLVNKATSIRADGVADDVAYPSEKAVRDLFQSLSLTGVYTGSAATIATIPSGNNGDWGILTAQDAANPSGIYITDGTNYSLAKEIADLAALLDAQIFDRTNTTTGMIVGGKQLFDRDQATQNAMPNFDPANPDHTIAKAISPAILEEWYDGKDGVITLTADGQLLEAGKKYLLNNHTATFPDATASDGKQIVTINNNLLIGGASITITMDRETSATGAARTSVDQPPSTATWTAYGGAWHISWDNSDVALPLTTANDGEVLKFSTTYLVTTTAPTTLRLPASPVGQISVVLGRGSTDTLTIEQFDMGAAGTIQDVDSVVRSKTYTLNEVGTRKDVIGSPNGWELVIPTVPASGVHIIGSFDYTQHVVDNNIRYNHTTLLTNVSHAVGVQIEFDGTKTVYTKNTGTGGIYTFIIGSTSFELPANNSASVYHTENSVFITVFGGSHRGDYQVLIGVKALPSIGVANGQFLTYENRFWIYDSNSTLPESDDVIWLNDRGATGAFRATSLAVPIDPDSINTQWVADATQFNTIDYAAGQKFTQTSSLDSVRFIYEIPAGWVAGTNAAGSTWNQTEEDRYTKLSEDKRPLVDFIPVWDEYAGGAYPIIPAGQMLMNTELAINFLIVSDGAGNFNAYDHALVVDRGVAKISDISGNGKFFEWQKDITSFIETASSFDDGQGWVSGYPFGYSAGSTVIYGDGVLATDQQNGSYRRNTDSAIPAETTFNAVDWTYMGITPHVPDEVVGGSTRDLGDEMRYDGTKWYRSFNGTDLTVTFTAPFPQTIFRVDGIVVNNLVGAKQEVTLTGSKWLVTREGALVDILTWSADSSINIEKIVDGQTYGAEVKFFVTIPPDTAQGAYLDANGQTINYGSTVLGQYATGGTAPTDVANITPAEFILIETVEGQNNPFAGLERANVPGTGGQLIIVPDQYNTLISSNVSATDKILMPTFGGWNGVGDERRGVIDNFTGFDLEVELPATYSFTYSLAEYVANGANPFTLTLRKNEILIWRQTGPSHITGYIVSPKTEVVTASVNAQDIDLLPWNAANNNSSETFNGYDGVYRFAVQMNARIAATNSGCVFGATLWNVTDNVAVASKAINDAHSAVSDTSVSGTVYFTATLFAGKTYELRPSNASNITQFRGYSAGISRVVSTATIPTDQGIVKGGQALGGGVRPVTFGVDMPDEFYGISAILEMSDNSEREVRVYNVTASGFILKVDFKGNAGSNLEPSVVPVRWTAIWSPT